MSVNKTISVGHVGKIEIRYSADGNPICGFSLACNESYKNKQGEKVEHTEWLNCTAFGKLAEIMGKFVKVGSMIYIEGKIKTDKYTDKAGVEKYSTKIIVNEMKMLGSKDKAEPSHSEPAPKPKTAGGFADMDDDLIPF